MCVRPSSARSARVEKATVKAAAGGGPRVSMAMRPRSSSNVSTASSSWSPTGMNVAARDTVSGRWIEDAAARTCAKCERNFSLVNRRHHCRVCGEIFCHSCSRTRMVLATNPGEIPRRQRVCDPCATHAHSSAVLYEAEDAALGPRFRAKADIGETSVVTEKVLLMRKEEDIVMKTQTKSTDPESSLKFMMASSLGFAAAFWFLKDEVALSNPAIWILLAGFIRNVYEIAIRIMASRNFTEGVTNLEDAEKIFSGMDSSASDDLSTSIAPSTSSEKSKKDLYATIKITPALSDELIASSQVSLDKVLELANSDATTNSEWTEEIPTTENVTVYSRDGKPSRIYKCEADIALSPDELFDELYTNLETSKVWNVTAAESNVICKLDETTDLVHLISAPALGGVISSRDFVNTRTWRRQDGGGYVIANSYAGKNVLKPQKGITRGENGPTGWVILPHPTSPFKSRLIWILNMDIKGYFPSSVIRKGSIGEVSCFVRNLRRYIAQNNASGECAPECAQSDVAKV
ncbi:steroidogenic acute regulatory protein [Plasmopara halstedii]|uniref:Steroidogenic acute regulatory protein n=1 Tax=Plasmopara halstedii TaxID=4781 RepID=A0A0P1ADU5_PLAHL|nr:steroidogenic acute regulatory protein [Plasmopara halstedii]CEG38926.1 steroidogenic acute regulatory protein [Plasmopara halstedii]|eukprot:XP_024575295.1 steroidogenic acute regulatory protein [Plasmopara halstedii]